MDIALLRLYQPGLSRWRLLIVLVVALCFVAALLVFGAMIAGANAASPPVDQLLAPFRWPAGAKPLA